jgi:hypothetical protein
MYLGFFFYATDEKLIKFLEGIIYLIIEGIPFSFLTSNPYLDLGTRNHSDSHSDIIFSHFSPSAILEYGPFVSFFRIEKGFLSNESN